MMGYPPSGGAEGRTGLLPAKLTTVVRFGTKGGLRDRAEAHHGTAPFEAHLGEGVYFSKKKFIFRRKILQNFTNLQF